MQSHAQRKQVVTNGFWQRLQGNVGGGARLGVGAFVMGRDIGTRAPRCDMTIYRYRFYFSKVNCEDS